MAENFTHLDAEGNPAMVDVSGKAVTLRTAVAQCKIDLPEVVANQFSGDDLVTKKGSVIQTAILAGIMAAKQTSTLIPLCHPLGLEDCQVRIDRTAPDVLTISCTARITGKTGVEMEALTGASVAALTIYDMCKAFSHDIVIRDLRLIKKTGGKRDVDKENT
ncbi:MAG: cyclic pyranopterin monophosphate synthase MoaC [Saprospiraceae bacterium]|nr:cyclic pyranopterin monophosphate synthase MoaC [Saprospiraceae bacterium]